MKIKIPFSVFIILLLVTQVINSQIDPNWLENVKEYQQPSWFNGQRVHIHSRLAQPYYNEPDHPLYSNWARDVIVGLGAKVFTRHIKTNDNPIHWLSAWGEWTTLAESRNIIQEAIDEAHNNNTKMIGYYNHYTDGYLRDNFPEYKCKDVNGNDVVRQGRGTMLCFNSPTVDLIQTRLLEFVKMGGDGIYFDELHMPRDGCWCNNCKIKYTTLTGKTVPTSINVNSQEYKDYQNFNNESVVEVFYKWRQAIETENSNVVMLIGSNTFPKMIHRHLNSDLMRVSHAHKTEWDMGNKTLTSMPSNIRKPLPLIWRGLTNILSRDASDGRPAHFWISGMSYVPPNNIKAAAAGVISFGNIANIDTRETLSPDADFIDAINYGNTVSPAFENAKPLRWLLIHFNEQALEKNIGTSEDGWINYLSPMYGSFFSAQQQRVPIGIITDSQIKQGFFQDAKVLFLPNSSEISSELQTKISEFEAAGGIVISQDSEWIWHNSDENFNQANATFKTLLDNIEARPFMKSSLGSSFFHSNYFIKEEQTTTTYLASYSNNLEWVTVGAKEQTNGNTPPNPVSGITLTVESDKIPLSVTDVVTSKSITYTIANGKLTLEVPTFQEAALVQVKYQNVALGNQEYENNNSTIRVYPSPTNHYLNIKNFVEGSSVSIKNILGKTIYKGYNQPKVDVSLLNTGIYFVTILNENKISTAKFIKK